MDERSYPEILDSRVEVPEHAVFRRFAAETVVLDIRTGKYHGLDQAAARMLEALVETGDVRTAAERLATQSERPFGEVARELCELCISLETRELIALRAKSSSE